MGEKNKTKGGEDDMSFLGNSVHFVALFSLFVISSAIAVMHYKST